MSNLPFGYPAWCNKCTPVQFKTVRLFSENGWTAYRFHDDTVEVEMRKGLRAVFIYRNGNPRGTTYVL